MDGYADLAVGTASGEHGGSVAVFYGSPIRPGTGRQPDLEAGDAGIEGEPKPYDGFGADLAIGDFDADGYGDLAISVSDADVGAVADAGAVAVIYGAPGGLTADRTGPGTGQPDVPGQATTDGGMGSLAAADFDGDGDDDLAIATADPASESAVLILPSQPDRPHRNLVAAVVPGQPGVSPGTSEARRLVRVRAHVGGLRAFGPRRPCGRGAWRGRRGRSRTPDPLRCCTGAKSASAAAARSRGSQATPGVADTAERSDEMGWSLSR